MGAHGEAPSPQPGLFHRVTSAGCWGINTLVHVADGSFRAGPDRYMQEGFAPVDQEVFAAELEVEEGALPPTLAGAFVRTGPNPALTPMGGYHWFDGDGMTHVVRVKDGKASYCNRWVDTARLRQERAAGWPACPKIGDYRGVSALAYMALARVAKALGVISDHAGLGTANTALVFHAGRLLALHEGDLPYQLRIACEGLVETLGRVSFGGKVPHSFTAHPKRDPVTGELFYFGYNAGGKGPYCWYGWCDSEGAVVRDFPVSIPEPVMMHDFALTENHAIIIDVPLVFRPEVMVKKKQLPFVFDKSRPARFGVLPRYATSAAEIKWFDAENFMSFHVANAWEEAGVIRIFLCTFSDFSLDRFTAEGDGEHPYLTEVRLDLASGSTSVRRVANLPGDFPVVPPSLVGRPCRYTYLAAMQPAGDGVPRFDGVLKIDLEATDPSRAVAGRITHGAGLLGGEAYFAARPGATSEDDGYLMTYVNDDAAGQSWLAVYDARTMSSNPVARLRLPQRVPYGFHSLWVTEEELQAQKSTL